MENYGFVRVAAASPQVKVADCDFNTDEIIRVIAEAEKQQVAVIVFPELSVTAYTCADLFHQNLLLKQVEVSIKRINKTLETKNIVAIVGIPLRVGTSLYNVAAVLCGGIVCGFVPKTFLPNYNEFYEKRWFISGANLKSQTISFAGQDIPFGTDLIFQLPLMKFGIEICEDLWAVIPPSSYLVEGGADIVFNLSASNEIVGKNDYRKKLVAQQSARCISGYVYASSGVGESTTDLVFSGSMFIAENGSILAEGERFSLTSQLLTADLDIERLHADRLKNSSYSSISNGLAKNTFRIIHINTEVSDLVHLDRKIVATPFVPQDDIVLDQHCSEILSIQSSGLIKRLLHTSTQKAVIGVSGGLDSTLALLVVVNAFDKLKIPHENIIGITMPGFGTSDRTYSNAIQLMKSLGVTIKEISIRDAVIQHFKDIDHDINLHDVTYENSQARERTQILMDYANKVNGLVIGTGDLSELALGWCTYNGDHMSMYAVNASVPKTLVRTLVLWIADKYVDDRSRAILLDVLDTPVSPELLPAATDGEIAQITEDVVGPYVLHDFFLYYVLRFGFSPRKIYFLAQHAFDGQYSKETILKWLKVFFRRFFTQQFKRSCMPDGPKVGAVNLSPRGDWRMPSDASYAVWQKELESLS